MELWVEYLLRHGMPIVRPPDQEPFLESAPSFYIPRTPPVDHRVWAFFILNNIHVIAQYSIMLEAHCNVWTEGLLVPPPLNPIPTISEQQQLVFRRIPFLRDLWSHWLDNREFFTSNPIEEIAPTVRIALSSQELIHP